jgi:N-acetylglucosamine kinase-like BadF-type ATPase
MTNADLILAVDGGGTKTQAIIADRAGNVLARGLGPSTNVHTVGMDKFGQAMTIAIEGALLNVLGPRAVQGPGWQSGSIAAACFGLAGVDSAEDEQRISRWVRDQGITPRFVVVNDSELILAGGTPEGWGVALISGTGSVCLGRSQSGASVRVGGWGPLIGDEGSGYDMAVKALRLATQTADGRAKAAGVLRAVLKHWSLSDAEGIIGRVHGAESTPADIASVAVAILDLAARGDADARAIQDEATLELTRQVRTVIQKLGLSRPPLAMAGGMLRASLRHAVLESLGGEVGAVNYITEPALGAVILARRLLDPAASPAARA